jgi:outer membrane protein assembly factor BamB
LADESGHLFGLELETGQIRYRLTTYSPFLGPTIAWGKKFLALGGRADRHTLFAVDLHTGAIHWQRDFDLSSPSAPVAHRNRIWLAGYQDTRGLLLSLDTSGSILWKRVVPLGPPPYQLLALQGSILLCASDGSAAVFSAEGEQSWYLGSSGDPLPCVVPGPRIRIVEPGGQVLAEVSGGQGLCGLVVDRKLNLYLLDDDGTLSAYRLASHFALVNGMKPYRLY